MSSPRECKYCGRPVKEGKNCTCHESFYMRKNAELQQQLEQAAVRVNGFLAERDMQKKQLEQAQARVAELERKCVRFNRMAWLAVGNTHSVADKTLATIFEETKGITVQQQADELEK